MRARQASQTSGIRFAVVALAALVLLPVLYVLSIGPAVWLQANGYLSPVVEDTLEVIYAPLGYLANNFEWVAQVLIWYMELFVSFGR